MDQIICEICGSTYAQTEERCPVCGYPRQGNEKQAAAVETVQAGKYKGGRFSRKNVRKRKKGIQPAVEEGEQQSNKPLWITIGLLLAAIILVTVYIVMRFVGSNGEFTGLMQPTGSSAAAESTAAPTQTTAAPTVPCTAVQFQAPVLELEKTGDQVQLAVRLQPADTTDAVEYSSSDSAVAVVSPEGVVTAMGPGQAQITVTCGEKQASCTVVCWQPEETTEPEQTQPPVLALNRDDVSVFAPGEEFTLSVMLGDQYVRRSEVSWSSSDSAVATVEDGHVTAVSGGIATITAKYHGESFRCIVRCRFENEQSGAEQEEQTDWHCSHSDVTIAVGESFRLKVTNSDGWTEDVIWTMSIDGIVSVEGGLITGRAPGIVTLHTQVDGTELSCIVRVNE